MEEFLQQLYRGGELLASGRLTEARDQLERAHSLQPTNEKGQNLLGLAYFKLGLFDLASEIYEALIRGNPVDPTLHVNLGLVYLKTNGLQRAIREFETATDLAPEHKKAHNYLGLALAQAGEYGRAREHFLQAGSEAMAARMAKAMALIPAAEPQHPEAEAPASAEADEAPEQQAPPAPVVAESSDAGWEEAPVEGESQEQPASGEGAHLDPEYASFDSGPQLIQPIEGDWGTQLGSRERPVEEEMRLAADEGPGVPPFEQPEGGEPEVEPQGLAARVLQQAAALGFQQDGGPVDAAPGQGGAELFEQPPAGGFEQEAAAPGYEQQVYDSPHPAALGGPEELGPELMSDAATVPDHSVLSDPLGDAAVPGPADRGEVFDQDAAAFDAQQEPLASGAADRAEVFDQDAAAFDAQQEPLASGPADRPEVLDQDAAAFDAQQGLPASGPAGSAGGFNQSAAAFNAQPAPGALGPEQDARVLAQLRQQAAAAELQQEAIAAELRARAAAADSQQQIASSARVHQEAAEALDRRRAAVELSPPQAPTQVSPTQEPVQLTEVLMAGPRLAVVPEPAGPSAEVIALPPPVASPSVVTPFGPGLAAPLLEMRQGLRLLSAPLRGPFHLSDDLVAVVVNGEMLTRLEGLVAWSGALTFAPERKRFRGRATEQPFGEGTARVSRAVGNGVTLIHSAGKTFLPLDLDDEAAYFREDVVFSFEEAVSFENGRVASDGGPAVDLVHLRGKGTVLLRLDGALRSLEVTAAEPVTVGLEHLVGWHGALAPKMLAVAWDETGRPVRNAVELTGEGFALLCVPVG